MVDYLTVHRDGKIEFTFFDGSQVKLNENPNPPAMLGRIE